MGSKKNQSVVDAPKKIHVHFLGIGGSGMTAVAVLAQAAGFKVSGCDLTPTTYYSKILAQRGIEVKSGHAAEHLEGVDWLVVTPAVFDLNADHEEVRAGQDRRIIMTWQEFMGKYLQTDKFVVSIAGAHGKSTTTAMMGLVLEAAGLDPCVELGAIVKQWGKNVRVGASKYFVCEADEYARSFLHFSPSLIILNNVEMDHPEFFNDYRDFERAFIRFVSQLKWPKILVVNEDSQGVRQLLEKMKYWLKVNEVKVIGYYFENHYDFPFAAEFQGEIIEQACDQTEFNVRTRDSGWVHEFTLRMPGAHNAANALGVIAAARALNVDFEMIQDALESFSGLGRRFEVAGEIDGIKVIDDYAHHPTAIKAMLDSLRQNYGDRNIWAVIEPHQVSRLRLFWAEFAAALAKADKVIITKIFLGREPKAEPIDPRLLADQIGREKAAYFEDFETAAQRVCDQAQAGDIVAVFGAGDSYQLSKKILEKLASR
jgi:UDP-N-acetylmuramate--alanine ligase